MIQQAELTPMMLGQAAAAAAAAATATGAVSNAPSPSPSIPAAGPSIVPPHTTQASSVAMSATSTPSTTTVSPLLPTPGPGKYKQKTLQIWTSSLNFLCLCQHLCFSLTNKIEKD